MPGLHRERSEDEADDVVDGLDVVELEAADVDFLDVFDVLAVLLGDDDGVDAGSLGGEDLLLDAADG